MNPHWFQGFSRLAATLAGPSGPDAGHAPQCRMRGRLWILPPDAPVQRRTLS